MYCFEKVVLATILLSLLVRVFSQSHAYDYGYKTSRLRYTRKVHLKQGILQGVVVDPRINRALSPVEQFLGIPYAAPPTRELGFMPPGSAPSWFGIKIADSFGPVCPQKLPDKSTMTPERAKYFERLVKHLVINQSEDCLYLNIYSPVQDLEVPLPFYPVMVFLHGESYEWNSGNPYDGSVLAAYGRVIVVTLNFRLGVFGFLKTGMEESAASNFGLVDQVAALLWVQDNIAAFGGDPNSVTLLGHGTGAVCANLLMLSPMITTDQNQLLFRRVILMGGTALADWAIANTPRQITYQVASALNCPSNEAELSACLRTRSTSDIVNVSAKSDYFKTRLGPIIDSRIIPNTLKYSINKLGDSFKRFEMMYGVTEMESAYFMESVGLSQSLFEREGNKELMKYLRIRCEQKPDLCLSSTMREYHAKSAEDNSDKTKLTKDKLLDMLSDARTVAPIVQMGRLHSVVNPQSYFYVFGHITSSLEYLRNKSAHGDELPYVFGVPLDGPKFHFTDHYNAQERLFSEVIMTYFSNFAHSGNPNVPRKREFLTLNPIDWLKFDVEWPEYDIQDESYLYLVIPPEVRYHFRKTEVRFWNEILSKVDAQTNPKPPPTPPSWLHPKQFGKTTTITSFDKFDNFYKPPTHPTSIYGTIKYKPLDNHISGRTIEYGSVVTAESEKAANSGSATNLLVIIGCVFLLVNIVVFAGLYYKCIKLKNKETKRQEEYQATSENVVDKKIPEDTSAIDGCNLMRMISKSSKSEDIYEAVKISEDGSNTRFKLVRQTSSSTIDPHTKVRDWIAQEIVQRCSPRFLRRTKQQLSEEHKAAQLKQQDSIKSATNIDSNSTIGQSPTRPVSPDEITNVESGTIEKTNGRPVLKRSAKVSIAIDATPAGRGISVMRQKPIEITKSFDHSHLEPKTVPQLKRSVTLEDVVKIHDRAEKPRENVTVINLKHPQTNRETNNGLIIQHQHSRSDPIKELQKFVPSTQIPCKKTLKSFDHQNDINVTSQEESSDLVQPLTPEQQLQTIKRRNFPKVLPDFPQPSKEALAKKRLSMPAHGYLNTSASHDSSFSHSTGKITMRLPPAVPPRTSSTLGRDTNESRVCETPAALAEEPPLPQEPEVNFNNLYIGPLVPSGKKSGSTPDIYKQNIQQIYEHLKPIKTPEPTEKRELKTIVTTDSDHPIRRVEPKVVIKPTVAKKSTDLINKAGARVIARNSNDEKLVTDKLDLLKRNVASKTSQIPTLLKGSSPAIKKESSSSESCPSEESDTGTVVKRV